MRIESRENTQRDLINKIKKNIRNVEDMDKFYKIFMDKLTEIKSNFFSKFPNSPIEKSKEINAYISNALAEIRNLFRQHNMQNILNIKINPELKNII